MQVLQLSDTSETTLRPHLSHPTLRRAIWNTFLSIARKQTKTSLLFDNFAIGFVVRGKSGCMDFTLQRIDQY